MFHLPRDIERCNGRARRGLRRLGPETCPKKPPEPLKNDLEPEPEAPMPSPWKSEGPKPLWELEQDARWRDLL